MTTGEALAVLGLAVGADPSEVRGAYLRAVKAHPPERDPEGFQRVRVAYELLRRREGPPRFAPASRPEPAPVPVPVPEPEVQGSPEEPAEVAPPVATVEPPVPTVRTPPSVGDLLAAWERAADGGAELPGSPAAAFLAGTCALEAGLVPEGLRLIAAVRARVQADQSEARAFTDADAWAWSHLREVAALPPTFPRPALGLLLHAVRAGSPALVRGALLDDERPGMREARAALRMHAPVLFRAVFGWDPLDPLRTEDGGRRYPGLAVFLTGFLVMVAVCFGLVWSGDAGTSPSPSRPVPDDLAAATQEACETFSPSPRHPFCTEAKKLRAALVAHECEDAWAAWKAFSAANHDAQAQGLIATGNLDLLSLDGFLAREVRRECP